MKKIKSLSFLFPILLSGQAFDGMTLFSPSQGGGGGGGGTFYSYLVDNDMNEINVWTHPRGAASMPYLLQDSTLLYPYRVQNPSMSSGGVGGGISKYSWDGDLLWNYEIANDTYQHHHDIEPLPNGNILVIVWEKKTASEAYNAGRVTLNNSLNEMWAEAILELEPVGTNDVNIVWEWHIWDHLIQDVDESLPNYGIIEEHPELQDVNYGNAGSNNGPGGPNGDWKHFNAVAYNADLDQIAISSRHHDEIYIIDHSTTTEEAAGHTGGNSGMGGDILYRWGNPSNYGMPGAQIITSAVHDSRWIENDGRPNGGFLQIFNNCGNGCTGGGPNSQANSTIDGIETPWDPLTKTYTRNPGQPYGPSSYTTRYECQYSSGGQSASNRMSNGNIFVNASGSGAGVMYEVDGITEQIVWGPYPSDSQKGFRYECDYPGIIALKNWLSDTTTCAFPANDNFILEKNKFIIYPNPSSYDINIDLGLFNQQIEGVFIYDMFGKIVFSQKHFFNNNFSFILDGLKRGFYTVNILTSSNLYTKHFSYL